MSSRRCSQLAVLQRGRSLGSRGEKQGSRLISGGGSPPGILCNAGRGNFVICDSQTRLHLSPAALRGSNSAGTRKLTGAGAAIGCGCRTAAAPSPELLRLLEEKPLAPSPCDRTAVGRGATAPPAIADKLSICYRWPGAVKLARPISSARAFPASALPVCAASRLIAARAPVEAVVTCATA